MKWREYHQATKHSVESLRRMRQVLDWANMPEPFRYYEGAPVLDLPYEEVVSAQEPTTRRLLAYLDLPYETACLEFHLNPAAITTASSVQARQPLYASSLDRWRHFATELGPLRARLESAGIRID